MDRPPAVVKDPPFVELVASVVAAIDKPPAKVKEPTVLLDDPVVFNIDTIPVSEMVPPTDKSVPTNNFLAMAIPPAVVIVPPFVDDEASAVEEIPIEPEINCEPVVELVETVVDIFVRLPDIVKLLPIANPPERITQPVETVVESVVLTTVREP